MVGLEPDNTEYLRDLSISFDNMGNMDGHRDPDQARQWYLKELVISEKLVGLEPDNTKYLRDLSISFDNIGDLDLKSDLGQARKWFFESLLIDEWLVEFDHKSIEYLQKLSMSYKRMDEIDTKLDPPRSVLWTRKLLTVRQQIVVNEPDNTEFLRNLSITLNRMGNKEGRNNLRKRLQWYLECLKIREKIVTLEPEYADNFGYLASSYFLIAKVYCHLNMLSEECQYTIKASESYEKAIELNPDNADVQYGLACTCARLGEADKALAALSRSINLGNGDADYTAQDVDLISLRGLPEFEALLERMRQATV